MDNDLPKGTRRVGNLVDFNADTPPVSVTLERDEEGISVTVPWGGSDDYYSSWFMGEHTRRPELGVWPPMPKKLLFWDSHGSVLLVDCWARGYHTNFSTGSGRVWARYAVVGVNDNIDYSVVNGVRSEVTGLREWLGVESVEEDFDFESRVLTIKASSGEPIEITSLLRFRPSWDVTHDGHESTTIKNVVFCESRSSDPSSWKDLMETHRGMRDLLVVSRWVAVTCTILQAQHDADPLKTLDGAEHGEQWRTVIEPHSDPSSSRPTGWRPHLVEYADLGPNGIALWLSLRDRFQRALDPIISDRFINEVSPVTHMAQVGPGLEALGFLIMQTKDGMSASEANRKPLRARLDRILREIDDVVPFDGSDWAAGMTEAYNGIKHANRDLPTELELLNRWRESVLAVRAWVALELGVKAEVIRSRLERDPQTTPYVART
ncbi:HEPN domain-containing protein [Arthrobacter sp. 2RAF6]|uniref:ApeA N-terminal domain 1-containing protein n=1 Tax=Arthrobacter sp. 2RAF6 TaxID=3233002 RepID=UPI003F8ED3D1